MVFSIGGGISNSWGTRETEAESHHELHDKIIQNTSLVRSLHSTVIVEAKQQESNVLQTRTVTNHNHCHALTVQYYEVLRNFEITTEFIHTRQVVLIPYAVNTFTADIALRFETILRRVLLDPDLAECFDAILRVRYCSELYQDTANNESQPVSGPNEYPRKLVNGRRLLRR